MQRLYDQSVSDAEKWVLNCCAHLQQGQRHHLSQELQRWQLQQRRLLACWPAYRNLRTQELADKTS